VADLPAMSEILSRLGLREVRCQENYRKEWRLGEVVFDFHSWPDPPAFVEVEDPTNLGPPGRQRRRPTSPLLKPAPIVQESLSQAKI